MIKENNLKDLAQLTGTESKSNLILNTTDLAEVDIHSKHLTEVTLNCWHVRNRIYSNKA